MNHSNIGGGFGLNNESVGAWRAILMHYGKSRAWSEGCVIIGENGESSNFVPGTKTLKAINDAIKEVGSENTKVLILESLDDE